MRISDWSSDVCSSDLVAAVGAGAQDDRGPERDQQPLVLVPVVDRGVEHRAERGMDLDAVVEAIDQGCDLFVGGLRGHGWKMRERRRFTSAARKEQSLMITHPRGERLDPGHDRGRSMRAEYASPRATHAPRPTPSPHTTPHNSNTTNTKQTN